jgi:hypothetical protein
VQAGRVEPLDASHRGCGREVEDGASPSVHGRATFVASLARAADLMLDLLGTRVWRERPVGRVGRVRRTLAFQREEEYSRAYAQARGGQQ